LTVPNLPLEDVLQNMISADPEPKYATVSKWCRLYPQYGDAIFEFFCEWSNEDFRSEFLLKDGEPQPPAAAARQYALDHMRRKGYIPPADKIEPLEPFDRCVLIAIDDLSARGHCVNITARVSQMTGASVLAASVLGSLGSLEKRGLAWSRFGGGKIGHARKAKQYYTITLAGGRALGRSVTLTKPKQEIDASQPAARSSKLPNLNEVLNEMMLEEDLPSYEALVRWCNRYPLYNKDLTGYFLTWTIQRIRIGEPQQLIVLDDEERLAAAFDSRDADEYALEILRRQNRPMPPPAITSLEAFDQSVLGVVNQLRGKGCLANINEKLSEATRLRVLPASTSVSLNRLEKIGLVTASSRSRETYFKITIGGKRTLARAR
jgi:DNA-binding PadR family transcriptional regulator